MRIMMDECCCDNMGCSNLVERDNCCAPSSCPRTAKEHTAEISRDPCLQWIVSPHSSHGQARRGDIFGDTARALDCKTLPKHEQRGSGTEQYRTVQSSLVLAWSSPPEPRTSTAHDMLALAETQGARATLRLAHRMESTRRYGRNATLTVRDWLGNARGGLLQGSQQDRASVVLYGTGLDWTGLFC